MRQPEAAFRLIGQRTRFEGHFFNVVAGTFLDPNGFTFEREIVRHPGAVCVVPLEEDGDTVLMVRQFRGAVESHVLELPAGKLDVPGEARQKAAERELAEEVGRVATHLVELGRFHNSPGFTDEETTCFLAEGLSVVGREHQGVEEEFMTIESVSLRRLPELIQSGEFTDAKSIISLFLAREHLERRRED